MNFQKEDKLVNSIKSALKRDAKLKPDFINNKSITHINCFEIGEQIILQLEQLIDYKVWTRRKLVGTATNMNFLFDEMIQISPEIAILYYEWLSKLIEHYNGLFLANEMYESVSNFTTLKKIMDGV